MARNGKTEAAKTTFFYFSQFFG